MWRIEYLTPTILVFDSASACNLTQRTVLSLSSIFPIFDSVTSA